MWKYLSGLIQRNLYILRGNPNSLEIIERCGVPVPRRMEFEPVSLGVSKIGYVSWYLGYVSVICPLDCCILACNQLEERPGRKAGEQGVGPRTLQCVTIRILRIQCRKEGTFIFLLEKACAPVGNTQVLYGQTDLGLTAIPYMPVMRPCLVSESYFPHLYSKDFCQD